MPLESYERRELLEILRDQFGASEHEQRVHDLLKILEDKAQITEDELREEFSTVNTNMKNLAKAAWKKGEEMARKDDCDDDKIFFDEWFENELL